MILTVTLNPAVDFTVFGTCFKPGTTNRGDDIPPDHGGKGINSARVARLLGAEVVTAGFLGGFTGEYIRKQLEAEGIVTAFQGLGDPTRITVSFVDTVSGEQTKIVPFGPTISGDDERGLLRLLRDTLQSRPISIVSMNGSIGRGMDAGVYGRLISVCAAQGVPVILDTSGEALAAAVRGQACVSADSRTVDGAGLFAIKPNLGEARALCGCSPDEGAAGVIEKLRLLLADLPCILLTLEAEGAVLLARDGCLRGRIAGVKAVSPICAGDAFVGGFLAAYDSGPEDIVRCFRWALAAGASTASVKGLLWAPPLFETLLPRVEIGDLP
jgi:1-phosphofructokinase family hexose kinase